MDAPALIKPTGEQQRLDVMLTPAIAKSLGDLVMQGKPLYPKNKKLILTLETEEGEKTLELHSGSLNNWITRNNVIPETGKTLRAFLDEKREEKRLLDERKRQASIIENAESLIENVVRTSPVEIVETYRVDDAGNHVLKKVEKTKNGSRMIEARVKAAVFGLERLNPGRYSQKVDVRAMVAVFPLSEIRKARAELERESRVFDAV